MTEAPRTILYIEDDPASRTLVERTLRHAGYMVLVSERGLDGMDMARRVGPDLILTDLNLPDISGREIATALRCEERFLYTPIVAITAAGMASRETTLAAGINGYITKPIDIETLPDLIDYYLKGGRDEITAERLPAAQAEYTREVVTRLESRIRELEKANRSLYQLDQMKDTFIQLTAHELRTPLTLVFGYSRLLEDYPPLQKLVQHDDNVRGLVRGLAEAIQRMHDIIDEILTISRIMTNQIDLSPGPTNLASVVRRVINEYEHTFDERKLEVHFDPAEWPATMQVDGDLLRLVFTNLIGNAVKYTPDGGHIYLKAQVNGENVRFSVRDTGIGIDRNHHSQIFERFYIVGDVAYHTTSKTAFGGGGLGLGLPICKGIVEAHGGRIWVESERYDPDRLPGSEFIVVMPLVVRGRTKSKIKRLQEAHDGAARQS